MLSPLICYHDLQQYFDSFLLSKISKTWFLPLNFFLPFPSTIPPTMYDDCDSQCSVHLNPSPFDSSPYFTDSTFNVHHLCNNPVYSSHPKHKMDAGNSSGGEYLIPRCYRDCIPCMMLVDDIEYFSFYQGDLSLYYFYDNSAECLLGDELITLLFMVQVFCQNHVLAWYKI